MIGAGAKILGNIEVGHCARIAAGSVVTQAVPNNVTVAGVPARSSAWPGCPEPARHHGSNVPGRRLNRAFVVAAASHVMRRRSFHQRMIFPKTGFHFLGSCSRRRAVDVQEVRKLDAYLKKLFGNAKHSRRAAAEEGQFRRGLCRRGVHRRAVRRRRGRRTLLQFPDGDPGQRSGIAQGEPRAKATAASRHVFSLFVVVTGRCLFDGRYLLAAALPASAAVRVCHQPVEASDVAPIRQPLRAENASVIAAASTIALLNAGAGHRAPGREQRAKNCSGLRAEIDQVLAGIGRGGAERQNGEPVGAGGRLGLRCSADRSCAAARAAAAPRPMRRW